MTRLPTPGGDNGQWGQILNDFLGTIHNTDGTLKDDAVTEPKLATALQTKINGKYTTPGGGIPKTDLSSSVQTSLTAADNARTPRVTALADGATITPDVSTSDIVTVTIAGDRAIAAPSGTPVAGQRLLLVVTQDGTGGRLLTWGAGYRFGNDIPTPTLTALPNKTDYVGFIYNQASSTWDCLVFAGGY